MEKASSLPYRFSRCLIVNAFSFPVFTPIIFADIFVAISVNLRMRFTFDRVLAELRAFSYPEPFLRAVRRGALAKSISELASDWLVLTPDIVFLPCFYGIRLWIWPESLVSPRVRRALGTRMSFVKTGGTISSLSNASRACYNGASGLITLAGQ
jgi:hypothetical protein